MTHETKTRKSHEASSPFPMPRARLYDGGFICCDDVITIFVFGASRKVEDLKYFRDRKIFR